MLVDDQPLTLIVLAAGRASRFGRLKQLEPVGPRGAALLDFNIHDARRCGFERFLLIVPHGMESRFRSHVRDQGGSDLDVACVVQPTDGMPKGRAKPWGTAHAVLAAADRIAGPFAVINGDDAYGRAAFALVGAQLRHHPNDGCLAAYRLDATLSEHGGVSRGICDIRDGMLTGLVEALQVRRTPEGIVGETLDGAALRLEPDTPTSMTLWGFPLAAVDLLETHWQTFLKRHGADQKAEFLLSSVVHELAQHDALRFRVLPTDARWFGLTYPADTDETRARIAQLVADGQYPEHLAQGLG